MSKFCFDIETAPLPDEELAALEPKFEPAKNLRDPEKIAADVAAKRAAWVERAALSAITGRVLAIGVIKDGEVEICHTTDEAMSINWFWDHIHAGGAWAGFNIFAFDLPFLVRRSWKLGIGIPPVRNGRYWSSMFTDLRVEWALGEYQAEGTLDQIAKHLGLPGKSGDGKFFHELYRENPEAALEYLTNDLKVTAGLERLLKA